MTAKGSLRDFESWFMDPAQGITIHPAVEIRAHDGTTDESTSTPKSYGVYATRSIVADTVLMRVPKSSLLSARTCAIANLLEAAAADLEPMTAVCLALLHERTLGGESPWHAYLALCPASVPISKTWGKTSKARRLLLGSEVAMVGGTTMRDFKESYRDEVVPFLKSNRDALGPFVRLCTFDLFAAGMSVVGSRAFEIDAFHGLGMCPFADMLDHEVVESVHFQTTFDVCPECGAAGACEHDPEESDDDNDDGSDMNLNSSDLEGVKPHQNPSGQAITDQANHLNGHGQDHDDCSTCSSGDDDDDDDTCDLITVRDISPGSQVYNTYGDHGNDVLLARYGFALPENPHDRISLGPEVTSVVGSAWRTWWDSNGVDLLRAIQSTHDAHSGSGNDDDDDDESEDSFMNDTTPEDGMEEEEEDGEEDFEDACFLTSSGTPSHTLLPFLILNSLPSQIPVRSSSTERRTEPDAAGTGALVAKIRMVLGAWQYVQPGRMPLPPFLFPDAVASVLHVTASLTRILAARTSRYVVPFPITITRGKFDSEGTHGSEVDVEQRHARHGGGDAVRFATLVRMGEGRILSRCESRLATIERACHWLLQRSS